MPKWPVSIIDGSFQVADADGAYYPIFMQGVPLTTFNPGWTATGLQTGLPPFHVLELRHDDGGDAYWMLDTALEFRSNSVAGLGDPDRELYLGQVEPLVRNLFEEAVLAPHAAIPSAAHQFDGFGDWSIADLIRLPTANAIGTPDLVSVQQLASLGGSYARGGTTLPAGWIEQVLAATVAAGATGVTVPAPGGGTLASQETLALPGHAAFRFHDPASGLVFYLLAGAEPLDRHLYVPRANAVFTAGDMAAAAAHDPLALLLVYYATHTDRAVMLPEAEALHPLQAPMAPMEVAPPAPVAAPAPPSMSDGPEQWIEPVPAVPPMADRAPRQNWWQRLLGLGQD